MNPDEKFEAFKRNLIGSEPGRMAVAAHLRTVFPIVEVPPLRVAPNRELARLYKDHGDIWTQLEDGRRFRVEVRHLKGTQFTCAEDWPYGWRNFMIGQTYLHDQADPEPDYYVMVSRDLRYGARLWVKKDRPNWRIERRFNRLQGEEQLDYMTTLDNVKFFELRR